MAIQIVRRDGVIFRVDVQYEHSDLPRDDPANDVERTFLKLLEEMLYRRERFFVKRAPRIIP
jgi:hypothetical protein